jgi:alpha-tubulin suppressor-like RCC1 family protein
VRLADGKDREFSSPVPVRVRPVPREFAISTYFVFAVMSDGTLRYWGTHPSGLKAEFAGKQYFARRPVEDRSAELAIGHHGLALREDGTVLAWGRNGGGQLGDGTREDRHTPRTVCGLDDVVAVASRGKHSLALRRDGTPWSWGESFWGQLGHREDVSNLLPAPVEGLADITAITSGFYSSYAVRADGAVFGWGLNDRGQLGVGDKETQRFPARTKGPPFIAIWAGNANVHALTADKDWYAWGSNLFLEGGTGSRRDLTRPLKQDMK